MQAVRTFEDESIANRDQRLTDLQESRSVYHSIDVGIDSVSESALWDASRDFRKQLQQVPEVDFLKTQFPGRCFVVPEWLKTGNRLHYGARVYLFRSDESPAPEDVIQANIDAIVDDAFEVFERYQGQLHGYPDCCIDFYQDRSPETPSPEWRSVEPFTNRIHEDALGAGTAASIDDVLTPFSAWEDRYAFFAREFFPEPECETAQAKGRTIYEELSSIVADRLVEDYFRLTFGFNYLVARSVHAGSTQRPQPGRLGREHLLFYAPLQAASTVSRYA